jgi:hypothetical protein
VEEDVLDDSSAIDEFDIVEEYRPFAVSSP